MARQMKDSGIAWIGEIPAEWSKDKVFRLFKTIGSGTTPKSTDDSLFDGNIHWIQSGDINGTVLTDSKVSISEEAMDKFSALKQYNAPFLVVAMYGASIGNMSLSQIDGCVNQACCVMQDGTQYIQYSFYAIKAAKEYLIRKAVGGGQPNISQDTIKQLWLPLPPDNEERRIADFLDVECARIDAVIEKTRASIEEYKKLKQSVITEAVTKGIRPGRKMKDSGIEWIGDIPEEWDVRRIKTIGTYRNGLTYTPEEISTSDEGTLVLRSSNIQRGKLCFDDNVYVSADVPDRLRVQRGDIILCSRNGSRELIGKCAIVEDDLAASFGAFMMMFRCSSPKYMYYILNSDVFKYYLSTFLTATINQLTGGNFGNMAVVYCSDIKEQQEIIDYLDVQTKGIDAIIGNKEHLLVELQSYKKSLIYEYVTGKKEVNE